MNRILILPDLAAAIAKAAGVSTEKALAFVKALFAETALRLTAGEDAIIDGIGKFSADPLTGEILFTPCDTIAAEINAPFAIFEPVEITSTDLNLDEPAAEQPAVLTPDPEPEPEPLHEPQGVPETLPAIEPEVVSEQEYEITPESEPEYQPEPETAPEPTPVPLPDPDIVYQESPVAESNISYQKPLGNCCRALNVVLVGLAIVAAYLIGLYTPEIISWLHRITAPAEEKMSQPEVVIIEREPAVAATPDLQEPPEAVEPVKPAAPAPQKEHLDTVRVKYYITHMAKRYFGNDNFWSYIYKENEDRLGHPDLTQPGTVVVIPPAEKYGIDAADPASVAAAKQLGGEIYRKFK